MPSERTECSGNHRCALYLVGDAPGATFTEETVHMSVGCKCVHEAPPGEVEACFVRGLVLPIRQESSSSPVQVAVGSGEYLSLLGTALHSERAVSLCFPAATLQEGVVGTS